MLIPIGFFGAGAAAGAFDLIESQVLSSAASSVSFTSIPAGYKHLQLRVVARRDFASGSAGTHIRLNSDSGSNYTYHRLFGNGVSVISQHDGGVSTNTINIGSVAGNNAVSNAFGSIVLDLLNSSSTNVYKTVRSLSGAVDSSSSLVMLKSGLWMSTAAISTIEVFSFNGSNWLTGSRFSLYGVKG